MENEIQSTCSSPPPPPQRSSSSSSFTAQLFGDSDSQPSSTGILSSIFPPPSTILARNTYSSQSQKETLESRNQVLTTTHGTSAENVAKNTTNANSSIMNMERGSIFQERVEPSPLSSSLYYGGQEDMYVCSSSNSTSQSYHKVSFKKMDGKDDPNYLHSASRGNWWQGSLYY